MSYGQLRWGREENTSSHTKENKNMEKGSGFAMTLLVPVLPVLGGLTLNFSLIKKNTVSAILN